MTSTSSRLTAMDLKNQEFRQKLRGYDPDEVRLALQAAADEIERLALENGEMREQVGELKRQSAEYQAREQTLQQTLVTAQSMTGEMKERAQMEAEMVVRQARLESERVLQQAQDQLARLEAEISRCKLERDLFERRLRGVIDEHQLLLERRSEERPEVDNVHEFQPRTGSADVG